jgi:hypothetical protein
MDVVSDALEATAVPEILAGQVPAALDALSSLVAIGDTPGTADRLIDTVTGGAGLPAALPADVSASLTQFAEAAADPRVLVSATVLTATAACIAPRGGAAAAEVQMAFTHVRLIPCLVKANLDRYATMLVEVSRPAAAALNPIRPGGLQVAADGATGVRRPARVNGVLDGLLDPVRDGFRGLKEGGHAPRPEAVAGSSAVHILLAWIGLIIALPFAVLLAARRRAAQLKPGAQARLRPTQHR